MSRKGTYNRYLFVKRMNKDSLILIKGKKRYITFDRDLNILKFIGFNFEYQYCNLSYLDKYKINYIVLDNLNVIIERVYEFNNFYKYLKCMCLCKLLDSMVIPSLY